LKSRDEAPATVGAHRCKAQNKRGEPCSATIVGPGGFCTAHDPERKDVLGEHAPDEAIARVEQRIAERLDGPF
jgi:hypothetical protein